jgi:hypothetical protein
MAARGVPPSTASTWYRDRAATGHPEKAGRIGRTDYWYGDEWTAWLLLGNDAQSVWVKYAPLDQLVGEVSSRHLIKNHQSTQVLIP